MPKNGTWTRWNRPCPARKPGRPPVAFTLTELLVVIAVIAILAALLLPVVSRAKLKTLQTHCLGNLREMAQAYTMYLSDSHDTSFPYDTITGNNLLWMGRLIDYQARVDAVRICPAASNTNATERFGTADKAWHHDSKNPSKRWYGSYTLNGWLYSNLTNKSGAMPVQDQDKVFQKVSSVPMPSQTPVFADSIYLDCWPRTNNRPPVNLYYSSPGGGFSGGLSRMVIDRHGGIPAGNAPTNVNTAQTLPGAINAACVDGHVELSKLENLWNFYWNQTWNPPNPRPF